MSVHFFLTGGELTWQYRRAIETAKVHGEEIVLWYTGARPEAACTVSRAFVPSWLGDDPQTLFNYLALRTMYDEGGLALGLDSISLRPALDLLPADKQLGVALGAPRLGHVTEGGWVYADPFNTDYIARPGCAIILGMVDELKRRVVEREHEQLGITEGGATGPQLLTRFVLDNPEEVAELPFPALCGWEFSEAIRFYQGEEPGPDVRVIQLYASGYPTQYATFRQKEAE